MGACYSRKAGGGKYAYSTVQMASTKLDDSSRLARPTPYARNSLSSPSVFASRKGIPIPTKPDRSPRLGRHLSSSTDMKTPKGPQPLQSSIPRFSSTTSSVPTKVELNENIVNANNIKNENNQLHMVNNNAVSNSPLSSDSQEKQGNIFTPKQAKSDKLNVSSKSCPDNMQAKVEEKPQSRIPAKMSYQVITPRSQLPQAKSSHSVSHLNSESLSDFKRPSHFSDKRSLCSNFSPDNNSKNSVDDLVNEFEASKISNATVESHESIIDFDSGIGSSFIEKTKPDDSDTLKDIERLESCDTSPVSITDHEQLAPKVADDSKNQKSSQQQGLKCPLYKRGMNGKWTVDDKNFSSEKRNATPSNGENIFKISMPNNTFPTYASYKGLMSYKKGSNNQSELTASPAKPLIEQSNTNYNNASKEMQSPSMKIDPKGNFSQVRKYQKQNEVDVSNFSNPSSPNSKSLSESDEKSDGIGSDTKSPISEIENREFLIDDEIFDQPELVCSFVSSKLSESPLPSLRQSVTELHALQMSNTSKKAMDASTSKSRRDRIGSDHRDSVHLSSELGSSCSSIASDDLMMDFEKRMDFPDGTINEGMASPMRKMSDLQAVEDQLSSLVFSKTPKVDLEERARKRMLRRSSGSHVAGGSTGKDEWRLRSISLPLRPPRPMSVSEADDGSIILDSSSYRLLSQDLNGVKTLLLRLKSVIQEAETINPFDQNIFFQSLVHSDFPLSSTLRSEKSKDTNQVKSAGLSLENADLRRQIVLLQQQLEEKDRTIHLLQQQMTKYSNIQRFSQNVSESSNAATQTERPRSLTGSLSPSLNNSSETLVSSVQDITEEYPKGK